MAHLRINIACDTQNEIKKASLCTDGYDGEITYDEFELIWIGQSQVNV